MVDSKAAAKLKSMSGMDTLREQLECNQVLIVPGVFDALSARIAANQDFPAIYMSGFAVAASLLGEPDIGLVTATEMVTRAGQIVQASQKPVIADGDNGYGGIYNVERLVRNYEQAGVSCIQLEDQVNPKRCGHMENKEVVSLDEARQKIAAAVAARSSKDFLIMARTDARATHDLNEALRRAEAFLNAGADILFVEAPRTVAEMQTIQATFPEVPLVANMVEDGKTPNLTPAELKKLGYQILLRPVSALLTVAETLTRAYSNLHATGDLQTMDRFSFSSFNDLVGLPDYLERS
ncbi:MAG: 2-methylisocitrate lyase-like PEP mutase family enzyme [Candidatus Azotimanducaceae bacterium]|jgi:2-methylisocitrate lyase-like PEP mutase family enzyme